MQTAGWGNSLISTLAPREGSDQLTMQQELERRDFNPRSPRGERHLPAQPPGPARQISTLAPREGSDKIANIPCPGG